MKIYSLEPGIDSVFPPLPVGSVEKGQIVFDDPTPLKTLDSNNPLALEASRVAIAEAQEELYRMSTQTPEERANSMAIVFRALDTIAKNYR